MMQPQATAVPPPLPRPHGAGLATLVVPDMSGSGWLWPEMGWGLLIILLASVALIVVILRAIWVLHHEPHRGGRHRIDDTEMEAADDDLALLAGDSSDAPTATTPTPTTSDGTATIEFALVFPIVLFLTLVMLQVMLLMTGNFFVQYAAFAAARTAIVQIPVDDTLGYSGTYGDEPANVLDPSEDGRKMRTIHQAAAFALMPVSGPSKEGDVATTGFVEGLSKHYHDTGRDIPPWIEGMAANRLRYAYQYTRVTVLLPRVEGSKVSYEPLSPSGHRFGPKDPVTVQVRHQFFLSIPYVRLIFADGENAVAGGEGRYTTITAQATLTNEGWNPALPPTPVLPRKP